MNPVSFDYKIMNTRFNAKQKTRIHVYQKAKQVHSCIQMHTKQLLLQNEHYMSNSAFLGLQELVDLLGKSLEHLTSMLMLTRIQGQGQLSNVPEETNISVLSKDSRCIK